MPRILDPADASRFYSELMEYLCSKPAFGKEVSVLSKVGRLSSQRHPWLFACLFFEAAHSIPLWAFVLPVQCIDRWGRSFLGKLRIRYVVINAGKYSCLAFSIVPVAMSDYKFSLRQHREN